MSGVVESFATRQPGGGILTVRRTVAPEPPYDANGYALTGSSSTFTVIGHVSPASGRDLKILADQGITSETRAINTITPLFTQSDAVEPDQLTGVTLGGASVPWVVVNWTECHEADGDLFYHVLVARKALK